MSHGITAVLVDPQLSTAKEVHFADANALWDAIDTAAEANKTYHEVICPNVPQKLHFRYKITEGQKDITQKVLQAIKKTIKRIWGKKLRDEQIILTSYEKDKIKHYDVVIAGYSVKSCREAQFAAKILKSKVKQWLVIDGTVYKPRSKWLIMHNYAPQTGASVKIPANPASDNQRVFNINSLVTWVKGTEELPNKSDRPFVPHVDANEGETTQNNANHPNLGKAVDEVPEEECPEDDVQPDQKDEVSTEEVKKAKKEAEEERKRKAEEEKKAKKKATKEAKKSGLKAALVGKKKENLDETMPAGEAESDKKSKAGHIKKSKAGHIKRALFGGARKRGQDDGELRDLEEVVH